MKICLLPPRQPPVAEFRFSQSPIVHTRYGNVKGYAEEGIPFLKASPCRSSRGRTTVESSPTPGFLDRDQKCMAFSAGPIQSSPVPFPAGLKNLLRHLSAE